VRWSSMEEKGLPAKPHQKPPSLYRLNP
jgi:hypothetical protein